MRPFRLRALTQSLVVAPFVAATLVSPDARAGTVSIFTESETLFWDSEPGLPFDANFGATLAMAESLPGAGIYKAFVGAPGAGAARQFEISLDEPGWGGSFSILPTSAQPMSVAFYGFPIHARLDAGGSTTSILRSDTGVVLVAGLDGGPVEALAIHHFVPGGGEPQVSFLAVGQPDYFGGAGRVRIYEQNGSGSWVLAETFIGGFPSHLGTALTADGLTVVAGAPDGGDNGRVHVFARAGSWIELQVIDSPATGQTEAEFGAAVALEGNHLVVGSPLLDRNTPPPALTNAGGVYVYDALRFPFLQFELQALLRPPGLAHHDWFGSSVDLLPRTTGAVELVGGAPGDDAGANNAGAVYRYLRTGEPDASSWHPVGRMVKDQPVDLEQLGSTVGLEDIGVLAGAPYGQFGGGATSGLVLFFDHRLFADGFESGDTSAWDAVVP